MNRLTEEKSPYLLQHAHNPVDWYPWGPAAFEKAREENKPIFLSIGYSTCHWCHVMAYESFEDPEIARLMNQVFVNIKVDREEHPAIDAFYMKVCHMFTGTGGWPLTIIMTPTKKPFFAATYLPKHSQFSQVGMLQLIARVQELWQTQQKEVLDSAHQVITYLKNETEKNPQGGMLHRDILDQAYRELSHQFDLQYGGFGTAPKFPMPLNLLFLLRYWNRTHAQFICTIVEKTLEALRCGGIFDQIGFGFHRYATDAQWRIPHFEKMLYDQALLSITYLEWYQATGKEIYATTAREIFTYVLRDLHSPQGGFYSAEDADSEGEEGKFYIWQIEDLKQALTEEECKLFMSTFNIKPEGNFPGGIKEQNTGNNVPYLTQSSWGLTKNLQNSQEDIINRLDVIQKKLFAYRNLRVHPQKDDKILTDWNGLMIAALAIGARVLGDNTYLVAAERAGNFIIREMSTTYGKLVHRYREGHSALTGTLSDYVYMTWGFLELYETTFQVEYLRQALKWTTVILSDFWDTDNGGFFTTPHGEEEVPVRLKEVYDGALPSGNSVGMLNMLRLSRLTGDHEWEQRAEDISKVFAAQVKQSPSGHCFFLSALDFALGPSVEVVVAGDSHDPETWGMLEMLQTQFMPHGILLFRPTNEHNPDITSIARYTQNLVGVRGHPTVYICQNYACRKPLTDKKRILNEISNTQTLDNNRTKGGPE